MNNNSIGFFDSGIGGITIWESINRLLPNENTIYFADSINSQYGTKSNDELINIYKENVDFLMKIPGTQTVKTHCLERRLIKSV